MKDGIGDFVIDGRSNAVNPQQRGTKAAAQYVLTTASGQTSVVRLRLTDAQPAEPFDASFDTVFSERRREADAFYAKITPFSLSPDMRNVQRQALAGLLRNKQYYEYDVAQWLDGDPAGPVPPAQRHRGRNAQWRGLSVSAIFSMPDKWEYPWFAARDLADAIDNIGSGSTRGLWNDALGFYYDLLKMPDGRSLAIKADTFSGLVPLYATDTTDPEVSAKFPDYRKRFKTFVDHNPGLAAKIADTKRLGVDGRVLLALVDTDKLRRILAKVLDPDQFLSPHGIRSVSRRHGAHPEIFEVDGRRFALDYEPAESTGGMFGGNSNWRGPIWFPLNYLFIEFASALSLLYGGCIPHRVPNGFRATSDAMGCRNGSLASPHINLF